MTEPMTDQTENNNLLDTPIRQRNISTHSTSAHQQIHTDEEDTDPDDMDIDIGDGSEYNTYNMDPSEAAKRTKKKNRKKDGKNFLALTSPTDTSQHSQYPQKNKNKSYIKLCVVLLCLIMAAGLIVFLYFYFTKENPLKDDQFTDPYQTKDPSISPTLEPTSLPSKIPTQSPTVSPTDDPSSHPTTKPTPSPSSEPTSSPTELPSKSPSDEPSKSPSSGPSNIPSASPSSNPSIQPSIHPSISPSAAPSNSPSRTPTNNPSRDPSRDPSIAPTPNPSENPSRDPSISPSVMPSVSPSNIPSNVPTTDPSRAPSTSPTKSPSSEPSQTPTKQPSPSPSIPPTRNPSIPPTISPSDPPSVTPTKQPTASPTSRILQVGNTVVEEGIVMTFPENAFPDSDLTIVWGEAGTATKAIFDDTTSAFQAASITPLSRNAIHFIVENPPLDTSDIVYNTTIPIPDELLDTSICPSNYGWEIFTQMTQIGFGTELFPIFVLFESVYDPDANPPTLTTDLFPEMFTPDGNGGVHADIILSCTPGENFVDPLLRRRLIKSDNKRRLLQTNDLSNCRATPILCPLESKFCGKSKSYGRDHYGVDFKASNENVIAAADGVIERSEESQTYGQVIIIRHHDGSATLYGKLRSRSPIAIFNATVTQGTVIGVSDDSHLHFEYIPNGQIYATKKRIDVSDCIPSNPVPTPPPTVIDQTLPPTQPTFQPSKSPLIPPSTHPPTFEPSASPSLAPTPLPSGSITVRDSGRLADDSFAVWIDNVFRVCETEIGQLNTCAISFLRPGLHNLTLEVLIAPDGFGTFNVKLSDGWTFVDPPGNPPNPTEIDAIIHYENFTPPEGHKETWEFTVPPATANNNAAVLGPP